DRGHELREQVVLLGRLVVVEARRDERRVDPPRDRAGRGRAPVVVRRVGGGIRVGVRVGGCLGAGGCVRRVGGRGRVGGVGTCARDSETGGTGGSARGDEPGRATALVVGALVGLVIAPRRVGGSVIVLGRTVGGVGAIRVVLGAHGIGVL